jgi:drug/metabolite transporter (DMT)-like permease
VQMLIAGALTLATALAIGERVDVAEVSGKAMVALAYLVVPGSILAYTAFVWLLQNASVSTATTYAYVNPMVALFLGWAFVDEAIGRATLASAVVIVVAVAVVLRREGEARRVRRREAPESTEVGPPVAAPLSPNRSGVM